MKELNGKGLLEGKGVRRQVNVYPWIGNARVWIR